MKFGTGHKSMSSIVVVNEVITNYKQIKQTVREWEESQKLTDGKLSELEGGRGRNNLLISGFEERKDEGYFDTLGAMIKFLKDSVKLEVSYGCSDCVTVLGRRKDDGQI
jgi:hypothetical protein